MFLQVFTFYNFKYITIYSFVCIKKGFLPAAFSSTKRCSGKIYYFFQFFIWSNKTTAKFDDIYPISISPFRINLHGALYPIIKIKTVYVKSNTSHTTSKMKKATTGVAYDHTINVWRGFTSKITEIYFSVKRNFDTQICRIFSKEV